MMYSFIYLFLETGSQSDEQVKTIFEETFFLALGEKFHLDNHLDGVFETPATKWWKGKKSVGARLGEWGGDEAEFHRFVSWMADVVSRRRLCSWTYFIPYKHTVQKYIFHIIIKIFITFLYKYG